MLRVDPDSPVPIYHQIVEAIRYRLATGQLRAGDLLPPVRAAAESWGVHLHTVRRAYAELAQQGLVEVKRPHGTRVLPQPQRQEGKRESDELFRFVERTARLAQKKFGISADKLAELLVRTTRSSPAGKEPVTVVECNLAQAEDYARQLAASFDVAPRPWCLDRDGEPPAGAIVSTFFHYNDVRARWPQRIRDIHFVSVHPDPDVAKRLTAGRRKARRTRVVLCETDPARAQNIAADLALLFPADRFRVVTEIVDEPGAILPGASAPVLFAPRLWARLSAADQEHPRANLLRYVLESSEARSLADHLGWRFAHERAAATASK